VARPPNIFPSIRLELKLPENIYARLISELYSPSQGRVPQGAYQKFFLQLLNQHWSKPS
jgi:hypothetical protein